MFVSARKPRGHVGKLTWEEVAVDVRDPRCADLFVARDEIRLMLWFLVSWLVVWLV